MKKEMAKSVVLPLILVPIGGLVVLLLCFLLYFGFTIAVESLVFSGDPSRVPMDRIRMIFTAILFVLGLLLLRAKWPELLKVILLMGPLAMLMVTSVLTYYMRLPIAVAIVAVIAAASLFLAWRFKKPWFYSYAILVTTAAAIIYAWPR